MREHRRRSSVGATAIGGTATAITLLPAFLVGAMAVQLTEDLAFGSVGLGLAVASYRAAGAVLAPYFGPLVDHLGATRAIRASVLISGVAAIGIALTAQNLATLIGWLIVVGVAHALTQPAANRLLANAVRPDRLGLAFGVKQSAPPVASTLAGFSVPLIALTLGWRWAYVLAAALAVTIAVTVGPPPRRDPQQTRRPPPKPPLENRGMLLLIAVAFGLGTSTSSSTTTFLVSALVDAGSTPKFAGTVLAAGSIASIGTRLACGAISDRLAGGHLRLCAALLAIGMVGLAVLATGEPRSMAVAGLVALAGVWGFNGVFWYALMRAYPHAPGRVTGALAPGALLGSTVGPIAFGAVVSLGGFRPAWATMAVVAGVSAAAMLYAGRRLAGMTAAS